MEQFEHVVLSIDNYNRLVHHNRDLEEKQIELVNENNSCLNEVNTLSRRIINIGLNILDKDGSWEQKQLKEKIRKNETNLYNYKKELYDILFVTINDQVTCNLIIDNAIYIIEKAIEQEKEQEKDKPND